MRRRMVSPRGRQQPACAGITADPHPRCHPSHRQIRPPRNRIASRLRSPTMKRGAPRRRAALDRPGRSAAPRGRTSPVLRTATARSSSGPTAGDSMFGGRSPARLGAIRAAELRTPTGGASYATYRRWPVKMVGTPCDPSAPRSRSDGLVNGTVVMTCSPSSAQRRSSPPTPTPTSRSAQTPYAR